MKWLSLGIGILVVGLGGCKPEDWTEATSTGPQMATVTSSFEVGFTVTSSIVIQEVTARAEPAPSHVAALSQGVLSMTLRNTSPPNNSSSDTLDADAGAAPELAVWTKHDCGFIKPCVNTYALSISWTGPDPIDVIWEVEAEETAGGERPAGASIEIELSDGGV